jgi:hypothetical protein
VKEYLKIVKELQQEVSAAVRNALDICEQYVRMEAERSDALEDVLLPAYKELMGDLINAVRSACLHAHVDPVFFRKLERLDILQLCAGGLEGTSKRVSAFKPEIEFPVKEVIGDFERHYREIADAIRNEWAARVRLDARAKQRMPFEIPPYIRPDELRENDDGDGLKGPAELKTSRAAR